MMDYLTVIGIVVIVLMLITAAGNFYD